jgi:Predicted transcriptional regulators
MSTHTTSVHTYTIKEAARLTGLPESTLRYYESIGIIEPINRDSSSKHRVYTEDNLNVLVSVACLSATGMSIGDMRKYIKNLNNGDQAAEEQLRLLEIQKQRLADEERYLKIRQQYVDLKIAYWHAVEAGDDALVKAISARARTLATDLKPSAK